MTAAPLLFAENLGIMRGERVLFRDISLTVAPGEAIILRGANGSGKTTLLRILAGLTQPEMGKVSRAAAHHWVGHTNGIKPDETPAQHLCRWALAWGADSDTLPDLLFQSGLERAADVPARLLSAGQKRRAALARLWLQPRPLWLLDEPFSALDTDGHTLLRAAILAHRNEGGAVIAAVHGDTGIHATREMLL